MILLAALSQMMACASLDSVLCKDDLSAAPAEGDAAEEKAAAEAAWGDRAKTESLVKAIEHWKTATAIDPSDATTYERLARAHYFYADGHLRFEDKEEEMMTAFEKGTRYAELAMRANSPKFRKKVCANSSIEDAVGVVGKESVPAMYWYATNLGKWALAKGLLTALKYKDDIFAMMAKVAALDSNYFYGASDRYFGAYYTKIPFPGGDLPLSQKHFEAAKGINNNYFATHVLMADLWASKAGNREVFESGLKYVLATPSDIIPELIPEQDVEKKKAALLMEDIDVLFE
jgi:hypothetical protein